MKYAIFCADPLNPRAVEPEYAAEAAMATAMGFTVVVLDHDLLDLSADKALGKAKFPEAGSAVYRGWMMSCDAYKGLYKALGERGVTLLTSPIAYQTYHLAPPSTLTLGQWMPVMTWVDEIAMETHENIERALEPFADQPVILKDYVKSQAHYWDEACFIPRADDTVAALRVINRFRELQGSSLMGGLVFKQYIDLLPREAHAHEYRAFFINGLTVGCWARDDASREMPAPPANLIAEVGQAINSPFVSVDFSQDCEGRWWLIEAGDGQVSSLPLGAMEDVFAALAKVMHG